MPEDYSPAPGIVQIQPYGSVLCIYQAKKIHMARKLTRIHQPFQLWGGKHNNCRKKVMLQLQPDVRKSFIVATYLLMVANPRDGFWPDIAIICTNT